MSCSVSRAIRRQSLRIGNLGFETGQIVLSESIVVRGSLVYRPRPQYDDSLAELALHHGSERPDNPGSPSTRCEAELVAQLTTDHGVLLRRRSRCYDVGSFRLQLGAMAGRRSGSQWLNGREL